MRRLAVVLGSSFTGGLLLAVLCVLAAAVIDTDEKGEA